MTRSTAARCAISSRRTSGVKKICDAMEARRRTCRPTRRFSSTVESSNSSMFWKVRAMPSSAIPEAGRSRMLSPSKRTAPSAGSQNRETRLKRVDLPAPFGPTMANTSPRSTENETRSRAVTPPNRRVTSRTSSRLTASAPS